MAGESGVAEATPADTDVMTVKCEELDVGVGVDGTSGVFGALEVAKVVNNGLRLVGDDSARVYGDMTEESDILVPVDGCAERVVAVGAVLDGENKDGPSSFGSFCVNEVEVSPRKPLLAQWLNTWPLLTATASALESLVYVLKGKR